MLRPALAPAVLAALTLFGLACGEAPTSPDRPTASLKPVEQGPRVFLTNLTLASSVLSIDGVAVDYTVNIRNDRGTLKGVILQGEIYQPSTSAVRGAGGTIIDCGKGSGILPKGTCPQGFTAQASNNTGGFGTLVPGPAYLQLQVILSDGTRVGYVEAAITLQ